MIAALAISILTALSVLYVVPALRDVVPTGEVGTVAKPQVPEVVEKSEVSVAPLRIAIVIDDFGYDIKRLRRLFELDAELAVAVLPHLRYSKASAEEAHQRGWEVLLHLPMEPENSAVNNPGQGALYTSMDSAELQQTLSFDLDNVPHVTGVNNHMGSKATADERLMRVVLEAMDERGLFFLDSRTSAKSVAGSLAASMGIRGGVRNIFLDNTRDRDYIRGQVDELVRMARRTGSAIAIGHPYTETLDVLEEMLPQLIKNGVEVVRLSDLIDTDRHVVETVR